MENKTLGNRFPSVPISRLALCEANCKKPVYTMHKWWARRLGVVFRMLLLSEGRRQKLSRADRWSRFYSPYQLPKGFTVLDPFLGGGTSLVEAAKLGATCVGVDIDPVACFVSEQELAGTDPTEITVAFERIKSTVAAEIGSLYKTKIGRRIADVIYYFWVDAITCPSCGDVHDGHPLYQLAYSTDDKRQTVICRHCDTIHDISLSYSSWTCRECGERTHISDAPVDRGLFSCPSCDENHRLSDLYKKSLVTPRLFALEYLTADGKRGFAKVTDYDLDLLATAKRNYAKSKSSLPLPDSPIPSAGRCDSRPLLFGYRRYGDLFNHRQLYCLGLVAREIAKVKNLVARKSLALAFSHCLASNNMFCGYAFGYRRLTPLFSVHAFRKISRPVEGHVFGIALGRGSFTNCVKGVIEGCEYMRNPYEFRYGRAGQRKRVPVLFSDNARKQAQVTIHNRSSEDLGVLANKSVDLILSDPPYFDNLPYSELSDFYHVWLKEILGTAYVGYSKRHTPMQGSLFAGKRTGHGNQKEISKKYTETLSGIFKECGRVAKPEARFIFTFHHRDPQAWAALGKALLSSPFRIRKVFPVRSEGRSGLHTYNGTIKWDSIFICSRIKRGRVRKVSAKKLDSLQRFGWLRAGKWQNYIRQRGLEFGWADRTSLAMSLALERFSIGRVSAKHLLGVLRYIEERSECLTIRAFDTTNVK